MSVHLDSRNFIFLTKSLVVVMVIVATLIISACVGDDSETLSDQKAAAAASPSLQTLEARKADGTTSNAPVANSHATLPTATPGIDMERARKHLWVHLSKCITFAVADIEAVQLEGIWYVRARLDSKHETGLWKILDNGQDIEPYDQRAKNWLATITGECAEENMSVMTTPTPVVTGAEYARTAIWSMIVGCVSELEKSNVYASENPSNAEWIITTDEIFVEALERESNFGVWSISYAGVRAPKDNLAKLWDMYLYESPERQPCGLQYLAGIKDSLPAIPTPTNTPNPTQAPIIRSGSQAASSIWAHLIPCFSDIEISYFSATFDSSKSNWVVLQSDGSTWSVGNDGIIAASNALAKTADSKVTGVGC